MNCNQSTSSPLVSIIIPCYKHAQFLSEAIESALAQTYPSFEVIVINDGSPDNTADVCQGYKGRIVYLEQQNEGLAETRNVGIRAAKGEYILPLDADDKIDHTFLAETVPFLQNSCVGYVYTDICEFGGYHGKNGTIHPGSRTWNIPRLLIYNISVCTALFRKCDWERVGGYCRQFVYGSEDWDFWLSLVDLGLVGHYVQAPLFLYRRHSSGSMWSAMMSEAQAKIYALLIERHRQLFEKHWPELLAEWAKRYQESFAYILKVEPILEEYYRQRPGRLEKYGVPPPIARLLRKLRRL